MIERTFQVEGSNQLTLRPRKFGLEGRTPAMPAGSWWLLGWECVGNHLRRPDLPPVTREGFEWAMENRVAQR